jgi:DNA-binding LacI/PurR family transcriptional regulator
MTESRELAASRHATILRALHRSGTVRVSELSATLGVAAVTLRRDIAHLADEGLLRRVHGGATLRDEDAVPATQPGDTGYAGMLVPSLSYYWPEVIRGAEEEAANHGLRVRFRGSSYETTDDRPQLERLLAAEDVRGLVVAPNLDAPTAGATISWLAGVEVPVVLVERAATGPQRRSVLESVATDHALGAAMAVGHLAELGHRRIALATSAQSPTSPHVRRGWREANPMPDMIDVTLPSPGTAGWDTTAAELLDGLRATSATAVLVHADAEAIALVQYLERHDVHVPADLSVVAYDDEVAGLFTPRLTAVRPPRRAIGRAALSLLAARLAEPDRPPHRVLISPTLNVRESTGSASD